MIRVWISFFLVAGLVLVSHSLSSADTAKQGAKAQIVEGKSKNMDDKQVSKKGMDEKTMSDKASITAESYALFAGGCFWCMEPPFEKLDGVSAVLSGYTGGSEANPTYENVSRGATSHVEAIKVVYDPSKVSYNTLLDTFWKSIDPTDDGGQFADRGKHYRSYIFYRDADEFAAATKSLKALSDSGTFDEPIVTQLVKASDFYPAEEYHQDYYKKNPVHYKSYRVGSGRAGFLEKTWKNKK